MDSVFCKSVGVNLAMCLRPSEVTGHQWHRWFAVFKCLILWLKEFGISFGRIQRRGSQDGQWGKKGGLAKAANKFIINWREGGGWNLSGWRTQAKFLFLILKDVFFVGQV